MKHKKILVLLGLLAAGAAWADEDVGLGPWRIGMTRDQVNALVEQGPFADGAGGALISDKGKVGSRKATVTLQMGDAGVRAVEMLVYEGKDWQDAAQAVVGVHEHFVKNFGGANVKEVEDNVQERKALETILSRTLGTAEEMNKRQSERGRSIIVRFEMVPLKQPAESRLQCEWSYVGKTGVYKVQLFQDKPGAPSRDPEDNIEIVKP